jgi:GNAT superfamily N-acetyltransferase
MKKYHLAPCPEAKRMDIRTGLDRFNLAEVGAMRQKREVLSWAAYTRSGKLIGGICGEIGYWNGLEIDSLWVAEKYRNRGVGSDLLSRVEVLAIEEGATMSTLNTFSFQAVNFYQKRGYTRIGQIPDFPPGHDRIYLYKKLRSCLKI